MQMLPMNKNFLIFILIATNILLLCMYVQEKGGLEHFEIKYHLKKQPVVREHTKDYNLLSDIYKSMPRIQNNIVFAGNSLTRNCDWAELFQNSKIRNRGIGGDNAEGLLGRIDEILDPPPEKIFFEFGLSDLATGYSQDEIIQNIRTIIEKTYEKSHSVKIFIQSVLPIREGIPAVHKFTNKDISALNEKLKKIASEKNCTYIDLHPFFKTKNGELDSSFSTDGVHINSKGYAIWKNAIEKYVKN
jgi:lysophospholipase L1-like esterase